MMQKNSHTQIAFVYGSVSNRCAYDSIRQIEKQAPHEMKHAIHLIQELASKINEIVAAIKRIMNEEIHSPILTIPGISYRMAP